MQILHSYADLADWAERPVYLAVGFFDGVHLGHQHLLAKLSDAAHAKDATALALTFSNSPRRFHQPQLPDHEWRYLTTAGEKLELLAETGIDATLILPYDGSIASQSARQFLRGLDSTAKLVGLCVGFDTSIGNDLLQGRAQFAGLCAELQIEMTWVDPYEVDGVVVKSSLARTLVVGGKLREAVQVLGYRYFISGAVVPGKGKGGSELGIPTANLLVPGEKLTPPDGIYAGMATVDGAQHPAALCLSTPTQHSSTVLDRAGTTTAMLDSEGYVLEAHLIGYSGDLYGMRLRAEFVEYLRGWSDFDSADALAAQMRRDIEAAATIFAEAMDA